MRFILAPLMAIGMFAAFAAAAADSYNDLPAGTIYAYWPDKKDGENSRVISITSASGERHNYRAVFKDPKDNSYDLASEDSLAEAMAAEEPVTLQNFDPNNLDHQVLFSVYLDKDGKVLYSVPGPNVPSSWREVKNVNMALANAIIAKLDPNTPGIEDIKDPNAAMAQIMLNNIAMQGPRALDDAKHNKHFVDALDSAYEASKNWDDLVADMEEKAEDEEEDQKSGKKVKRHNKKAKHHHHQKASSKNQKQK